MFWLGSLCGFFIFWVIFFLWGFILCYNYSDSYFFSIFCVLDVDEYLIWFGDYLIFGVVGLVGLVVFMEGELG